MSCYAVIAKLRMSIVNDPRTSTRRAAFLAALLAAAFWPLDSSAASDAAGRYRLLFDDYHQIDRGGKAFPQGVALDPADRTVTNHYSPEINALPNGTFVLAHLISDRFRVDVSPDPITADLLQATDAYMIVCPVKKEFGGRAELTDADAGLLEKFVARGGMLILVLNSHSPSKERMDWDGMNRVARRFGVEFLEEETGILSLPLDNDSPLFDGVKGMIFGNGTTLRLLRSAATPVMTLKDPREGKANGIVGTIVPYGRGRVLAFGDGGTFGNAHMFRSDISHARAVRQMFYGLLPDGPAPAYGWSEGLRLRVRLSQEQFAAGYPEENRLLNLPATPGTEDIVAKPRAIDVAHANGDTTSRDKTRYLCRRYRNGTVVDIDIGAPSGDGFSTVWTDEAGNRMTGVILPKGAMVDTSAPAPALAEWQWALAGEVFCAPLKGYIRPGESWTADDCVPLFHAQLQPTPVTVPSQSTFRFEGEEECDGRPCFLFSRTRFVERADCRFQDFVQPEYLEQFGPENATLLSIGEMAVTRYWISRDALLPVRTELRVSGTVWWYDKKYPERFEGEHDWRTFENLRHINFVTSFGRVLTAEFEVRHPGRPRAAARNASR